MGHKLGKEFAIGEKDGESRVGNILGGEASMWSEQVDPSVQGVHTTHAVTSAVQEWITAQVTAREDAKTFAYVAHAAVHGPLQVPAMYVNDECRALVPADHPSRLIYCGMVRAVDEAVANITSTYEALGILNDTLVIVSSRANISVQSGGRTR